MRLSMLSLVMLACFATAAAAAPLKSVYTSLDLGRCKVAAKGETFTTWSCPGTENGFDIVVSEDDARFLVSFGKPAAGSRASTQTLRAFNTIFKKRTPATVEWRLERKGAAWRPFATILRYYTQSDASGAMVSGQVLVVSRVGGDDGSDSCHVAYVDALANPDANALAVKAADELARGFDCQHEPGIVGKSGRSPM